MKNNLIEYFNNSTQNYADKSALIMGDISISYKDLKKEVNNLAYYFISNKIKPGDNIAVCLGNKLETIICFWAALMIGAVISIIDYQQAEEKIEYIIDDLNAKAFITLSRHNLKFLTQNKYNKLVVLNLDQFPVANSFNNKLEKVNKFKNTIDLDLAAIIYTSGSTGEPKGVMLSHRNMITALESINSYLGNTENDCIISALPLSFDYGLYQILMMMAVGGTLILEDNFTLPSRFLKLIEHYKPTAVPVVPSMVPLLQHFNNRKKYDLSSVRYVTNTGAALMGNHITILENLFNKAVIFSMYGLTECKRCTYLPPKDLERKVNSIGIPIPNTQMWIIDENGKRLEPHQIGQIVVRGQTIMKGYLNKPQATFEKLKPGLLPGEWILHTGDYGMMDEEGYFYFYGRMDDVIKSRGLKVIPKEIETNIAQHCSLTEIAAVGIEHQLYGQAIVLFVSANDDVNLSNIQQACKKKLKPHQQPVDIVILNNIPKTTNGKIDKRLLANQYNVKGG